MKLKPLKNFLIVQKKREQAKTQSGIFLTGNINQNVDVVRIIAHNTEQFQEDQEVLIPSDAGERVIIDGEEFIMLSEDEILAVIY